MSLHLHRAERADRLVAALGELLADPLPDPFSTEVVSVPTPGVERWLTQRLATRLGAAAGSADGVCAGISFPSTRRLVARALGEREGSTIADPWRPEQAVWPLLRVLDASRGEAWSELLWRYLGDRTGASAGPTAADTARGGRRWSTARHLAGLFARYAAARPAMLLAWAAGQDVDGEDRPLGPDRVWQAELWRRLRAEIGQPSPAERTDAGSAALRADPSTSDLPERVSLFGPTRIEPQHVTVLAALAASRDVHLWLPHPSPALWARLARSERPAGAGAALPSRRSDPEDAAAHRLLAYLGRDVRELQLVLAAAGATGHDEHLSPSAGPVRTTLLQRLQADIVADRPLSEADLPMLTAGDDSIALHASHGPDRQVEVLREVLVGLLKDDPSLEPRDIVVMCPDVEAYAPLVAATFGLDSEEASAEHPGHRLRVRLADRSLRQVNPLLSVLSRLVALAGARMESAALLDFCASPPVARRFGFGTDELERLHDLVTSSGVRWGLDSAHRAEFGMAGFGQNTWRAGLDRLLLGVTMDETGQQFLGTALPLDDVDSADVDLVGRLTEFVARLASVTDRCRTPQALSGWVTLFREALELLTTVPTGESWQVGHAQAELLRLTETSGGGAEAMLSLPEVSALLAEAFRGRPGRSNFRTGTLTMCTMHPMRSIPHRVVCLLGLDDGVFPRHRRVDGDDVAAVTERIGDADPRSEDRQLLLDAVMAAEEHLVVVYAGMDARTGDKVPPAVPLKELMDTLDLTARSADGRQVSAVVTVRHRLQPYDPANFDDFSFDRAALRGAWAAAAERTQALAVFGRAALTALPGDGPIELAELVRFFRHPVRALLRTRAGVSFYAGEESPDAQIPVQLDGLGRWEIGERLLQLRLQGAELDALQAAEWRRGLLPPRTFGSRALDEVSQQVAEVHSAAAPYREQPATKVEIAGQLAGRPLVGTVTGVHGDDIVSVSFSRLSARHRLVAWLELLAVTVAYPGRPWRAVCVARRGMTLIGPIEPGRAEAALTDLAELRQTGLREPLPFAPKTSALYSQIRRSGQEPTKLHRKRIGEEWAQEIDDSYARFFGSDPEGRGRTGLDLLMLEPARPGEEFGTLVEPTRFGTLARRVFDPLFYVEGAVVTSDVAQAVAIDAPEPFDVCGPLPIDTTVLEASAGTGKTFTIAALTARYLAEGVVELGQLMLVTFGRNASLELRLRVRDRLVTTDLALRATLAGLPLSDDADAVVRELCSVDVDELDLRQRRVARALADFDSATIATTHEFCLEMLDGLGVLGDREPQAVFVEHLGDLTREVASDVYLRRYAAEGQEPFSFADALKVAQHAVVAVHARLVPEPQGDATAGAGGDAAERVAFAAEVRAEVERRKLVGRLFTYDDMLTRLRDALTDPAWGGAAAERLRERYAVVMVDEFQDTDPVQWQILRRAFHGHATLILIGDPKQAIYAFRGADVYSYLDARASAGRVQTLSTNWRSDAAVVEALDQLMGGAALGDSRIVVRPVHADAQQRRLRSPGESSPPALRLRVKPFPPDGEDPLPVGTIRPEILTDLVTDVTATLGGGHELCLDGGGWRPVEPADIAVLVRTNERGEELREALVAAGVPAVMLGAASVFGSPMAAEWLTLLTALEQPRQQLARRAALTPFFGWTFAELAEASEARLTDLAQRVRWWSRVLASRGVAALLETITTDTSLPERLLGTVGGERRLTDLRHLAEALHAAMVAGPLGTGALREWLQDRMAEARSRLVGDGTRRLETDAAAVTVVTVHRSKGLEYPLVYLPDAWDRHVRDRDEGGTLLLHLDGGSVLDVGGRSGPGRAERFRLAAAEDAGEHLRLLYVALTRAQCQVVTWWAPSWNTPSSSLQRFLYRSTATDAGSVPEPAYPLSGDPFGARPLGAQVALETMGARPLTPWRPPSAAPATMRARVFDRPLDLQWRRTSYSGLTAAVHGLELPSPAVGSEAEPVHEDDESQVPPVGVGVQEEGFGPAAVTGISAGADPWATPSPMAELPSGVDFGTAVHAVFELVDPGAEDLAVELRRATALALGHAGSTTMTVDQLATALLPAFGTPLGPLAGQRRLCDLPVSDRLPELGFEMPLAGGDTTRAEVTVGHLVPLLRAHLPATDPLGRYAELVAHPALAEQPLRGYLTGSIDAVLRVRDDSGQPRYLVVDYKTNWLGTFDGRPLLLADYAPARLAEAMMSAHYPLQALLYSVAVHRLLRWRQPGYDSEVHLGGALYLFVRGMAGPDTPTVAGVPAGVFSWRPPAALVTELSDLLDGTPAGVPR